MSAEEYAAIWHLVQKTNMVIYATDLGEREDKESIKQLAAQFGLQHLDANWLADEDGISSLTPQDEEGKARGEYIPYTHHRIRWHTDGYYNPPERRIFAMTLHCVRAADEGGENELMDHELAYHYLRDADPNHIRALMAEDAMTIPARTDEQGVARPDEAGPALLVDAGQLHLRYTARTNLPKASLKKMKNFVAYLISFVTFAHSCVGTTGLHSTGKDNHRPKPLVLL